MFCFFKRRAGVKTIATQETQATDLLGISDVTNTYQNNLDPIPKPEVRESNSDSVWAAFDSLGADQNQHQSFKDTVPNQMENTALGRA
jgi:hypothetical protein